MTREITLDEFVCLCGSLRLRAVGMSTAGRSGRYDRRHVQGPDRDTASHRDCSALCVLRLRTAAGPRAPGVDPR